MSTFIYKFKEDPHNFKARCTSLVGYCEKVGGQYLALIPILFTIITYPNNEALFDCPVTLQPMLQKLLDQQT